MLSDWQSNSDELRKFMRDQATNKTLFSIRLGCAECGDPIEIQRAAMSVRDGYELWETDGYGVVALCTRCAKKIFSSDISGDRDNEMLMVEIYLTRDVAVALDAEEYFSGTVTPEEKFDIQRKLDRLADDIPDAADCGVYETAVASLVRSHIGTGGINQNL